MGRQHVHSDSVKWAAVAVPESKVHPEDWRLAEKRVGGEIIRVVLGWCPECDGEAVKVVPIDTDPGGAKELRKEDSSPGPQRSVFVSCDGCGYTHAHEGSIGCGRQWAVPWNKIKREGVP